MRSSCSWRRRPGCSPSSTSCGVVEVYVQVSVRRDVVRRVRVCLCRDMMPSFPAHSLPLLSNSGVLTWYYFVYRYDFPPMDSGRMLPFLQLSCNLGPSRRARSVGSIARIGDSFWCEIVERTKTSEASLAAISRVCPPYI